MKRFLVFITLFSIIGLGANAQRLAKGSFGVLSQESNVKVEFDYSESLINNLPFEDFLETEEDWEDGYKDILLKFVRSANESGNLRLSTKIDSNYKLVFKVSNCKRDGDTEGTLLLLDNNNEIIAVADNIKASGGKYGTQVNLMGDAAKNLGKKIGSFLKKQIQ